MVDRAWLRPMSVREPPQGDFAYLPVIKIFTDSTAAGLEAQLEVDFPTRAQSTQELWVLEQIQYEVAVLQPKIGMNPPILEYSAMIWATKIERV